MSGLDSARRVSGGNVPVSTIVKASNDKTDDQIPVTR